MITEPRTFAVAVNTFITVQGLHFECIGATLITWLLLMIWCGVCCVVVKGHVVDVTVVGEADVNLMFWFTCYLTGSRIVVVTGLPPKVMTVDKLQALFPNCASVIPGATIITKDCG